MTAMRSRATGKHAETETMTHPPVRRTRLSIGVAIVAAALTLSACAPTVDGVTDSPPSKSAAFAHIHALTMDPDGDELLVATHEGLYRLAIEPDGSATAEGPIGGFDFDPMGFTLRDGIAYASGHPGPTTPSSFGNPNLGLIVSDDLGKTWTNMSLTGQTDFHALTVVQPSEGGAVSVFGIDSGRQAIQRSFDGGQTWTDGAEVVARDILADPSDPGTIYVTTEDGLAVSRDDASTFAIDTAAPPLYLISADLVTGCLAGIDVNGTVWTREGVDTWVRGGQVSGAPQAFTDSGDRLYVADDRGIAFSEDNGESWTVIKLSS